MILRFQVLEYEKRPKVIDFEFDGISKALDFLMKGRLVSDFEFDVSQYLLYTRGSVDNLVYQVTRLDKESGKNIDLEDLTFKVIARYIDETPNYWKNLLRRRANGFCREIWNIIPRWKITSLYLQWITNRKSGLGHSYFVMVDFL